MQINNNEVKTAAKKLRAINHPLRQSLMDFIDSQKEVSVTSIYQHLKLEQSVASQHLKILRDAGIVKTRREGKNIFYSVNHDGVAQLCDLAKQISSL